MTARTTQDSHFSLSAEQLDCLLSLARDVGSKCSALAHAEHQRDACGASRRAGWGAVVLQCRKDLAAAERALESARAKAASK